MTACCRIVGHTCRVCHELRLAFAEPKTIRAEHAISFLYASLMRRVAKVAPRRYPRMALATDRCATVQLFAYPAAVWVLDFTTVRLSFANAEDGHRRAICSQSPANTMDTIKCDGQQISNISSAFGNTRLSHRSQLFVCLAQSSQSAFPSWEFSRVFRTAVHSIISAPKTQWCGPC